MRIGIPAERYPGEGRVAATPETVKKLVAGGHHTVVIESGAGVRAIPLVSFVARQLDLRRYFVESGGGAGSDQEALDNAHREYGDEERAHRTAWAAVKRIAEKKGDHWELKDEPSPSDEGFSDAAGGVDKKKPKAKLDPALVSKTRELRDRYGRNTFGQSCLMARRLVERGVRFVQIYHGGGGGGQNVHLYSPGLEAMVWREGYGKLFPKGTRGSQLDSFARRPLWRAS